MSASSRPRQPAKTPTVLNLILLGTDYHHLNPIQDHLLTLLARSIEKGPNQFVHLIDGPGGGSEREDKEAMQHPMLGDYNYTLSIDDKAGEIQLEKTRKSLFQGITAVKGRVTGAGYHDAIKEATDIIMQLHALGKAPLIVNMYGFSRGADTAVRIANRLDDLYERDDVRVNLFAVDPVPGAARRHAKKAQIIPGNVEEYHCILMQDENRPGFEPQDKRRMTIQDPAATTVTHKIYGGIHKDGLRLQSSLNIQPEDDNSMIATLDTTQLVWDDLHKFAWRHATLLKLMPYLLRVGRDSHCTWQEFEFKPHSDAERLLLYSRMRENRSLFKDRRPVSDSVNVREVSQLKYPYHVHGETVFQDDTHVALFAQSYPAFFDYYFQRNLELATGANVLKDVAKLKQQPLLQAFLQHAAGINITHLQHADDLGKPQGIYITLKDLRGPAGQLWNNILALTNPVLTGLDDSVDARIAMDLVTKTRDILIAQYIPAMKVTHIQALIAETIDKLPANSLFSDKLALLLPSTDKRARREPMVTRLIDTLQKVSTDTTFFQKELNSGQKKIARETILALKMIDAQASGNDVEVMTQVLRIALHQSRILDTQMGIAIERESHFDKLLRQELLRIANFPALPDSKKNTAVIKATIATLKAKLAELTTPVSPQTPEPLTPPTPTSPTPRENK